MSDQVNKEAVNAKEGLRYNQGKLRYDLLEPYAIEQLAKVFTKGAEKYAPRNWEKGMSWSSVLASLKRHIAEFEKGVDFDPETLLLHASHMAWNAMALVSYYKIAPEFDDRRHTYLNLPKVGVDIDGVLADFATAWVKEWNLPEYPTAWTFDRFIGDRFKQMKEAGTLDNFYLGLKPLIDPKEIPFEISGYFTSRPVSTEVTEQWLHNYGFPAAPVYTVPLEGSKVQVLKDANIDIYVDDNMSNFVECNNAGICTFLQSQPYNERFNVGYKKINSLKDLPVI